MLHPCLARALPENVKTDDTPSEIAADTASDRVQAIGRDQHGRPLGRDALQPGADLLEARLVGADLIEANLAGARLSGARVSGANLTRANLAGARMSGARVSGANLTGVNLIGARLVGADLIGADLTGADLTGASLINANLTEADLTDVDLTKADLAMARLIGANLSGASLRGTRFVVGAQAPPDLVIATLAGARWSDETVWPSDEIAAAVAQSSRLLGDGYEVVVDDGRSRDHYHQPSTPSL
nr:pentapeptide repeat-containing protein [Amycolatopsis sp. WAC 01375]